MTGVLLDTHVLVWLVNGDAQLSRRARKRIASASQVWVSAITPWEIGMLVSKRRLVLAKDAFEWVAEALALPGIRLAALEPAIALASTRLPGDMHGDPADCMLAATARHLDVVLVTADEKLLAYGAVGHLAVVPAR